MDLSKFKVTVFRQPHCATGETFGPVYSDRRLSGAFACLPASVAAASDCDFVVAVFQRDPRADSVTINVDLDGRGRLFWPDHRRNNNVSREQTLDMSLTNTKVAAAKAFGLGSWGAYVQATYRARCSKKRTALLQSPLTISSQVGKTILPVINAYVTVTGP